MKKIVFEYEGEYYSPKSIIQKFDSFYDEYVDECVSFLGSEYTKDNLESTFNMEYLSEENFTSLLRVASLKHKGKYMFPNIVKALNNLGFNPLPIKTYAQEPDGEEIKVNMRDHQIAAIEHIRNREQLANDLSVYGMKGSILKLEMGLGKTLVSIVASLITPKISITKDNLRGFPTLIIASKTIMDVWKTDGFDKFFHPEDVNVLYLHKSHMTQSEMDDLNRDEIIKYDFVVTTYDFVSGAAKIDDEFQNVCVIGDPHSLMKGKIIGVNPKTKKQSNDATVTGKKILFYTPWERVICDESHILNPTTFIYKAIMCIYGEYKLCLTGTPIKNYNTELWAQLRFCGYTGTPDKNIWKHQGEGLMKTHKLKDAILSMDYSDTKIKLPPTLYIDESVIMSEPEQRLYDLFMGETRNAFDLMTSKLASFASVLALFTRLRQICIAPYLITTYSKRECPTNILTQNFVKKGKSTDDIAKKCMQNIEEKEELWSWIKNKDGSAGIYSSKMTLIINTLRNIPKGEKVAIFSSFTSFLDLLGYAIEQLLPSDYQYEIMDGDVNGPNRVQIINKFKTENVQALLLTYKVGAEGLNLTEANHVICAEPWWTPAVRRQAESRVRRMGQKRDVTIHNLYIQNSVEDRILEKCKEKEEMAENYLEGTKRQKTELLASILGI